MANAADFITYTDPRTGKRVTASRNLSGRQGVATSRTGGSSEIKNLQAQIMNQQEQVRAAGQTPGKKKGVLDRALDVVSRPLDVLSRPLYGVNEGLNRLVGGIKNDGFDIGDIGSAAKGVGGGLSGRNKTFFSDVLDTAGVENKWVKGIGGFVGDVALDPLTYITFGVSKAAKAVDMADSLNKTAKKATHVNSTAWKTAKRLEREEFNTFRKAGVTIPGPKRWDRFQSILGDVAYQEVQTKKFALEANNRGRLLLKAGVPFGPKAELGAKSAGLERVLEAAYSFGAKTGSVANNTEIGGALSKAFRPGATFVGDTHQMARQSEMRGASAHRQFAENVKKEMRSANLTKEQRVRIAHHLEDPSLTLSPSEQRVADWARKEFDDMFSLESSYINKYTPNQYAKDYVNHWYRKGSKQEIDNFKKYRKNEIAQGRKVSLAEAKQRGLDPVERIDEMLVNRYAEHQRLMARHEFRDSVLTQYGVELKHTGLAKKMGLEHVDPKHVFGGKTDYYLPPDVMKAFKHMDNMYTLGDEEFSTVMRKIDKVVGYWKFGATAANPGHHIRNLIGDVYLNYLDGVVDPRRYKESLKVLTPSQRKNMKIAVGKTQVSGEDLLDMYRKSGAESGFIRSEFGSGSPVEVIREMSEKREDFGRLAHFIDALKKEGKNANSLTQLDEAAKKASQRVRKWNLDYGDLTNFERRYMKRAMPFYTWMRKNVPLQFESLATRPGKVLAVPKGFHALEELLGTADVDSEPFPQWLKEMSFARLGNLGGPNPWVWSPALPSNDIASNFGGGLQGVVNNQLNNMTPLAKIPLELGTDRNLFTGAQRSSGSQYVADQIPVVGSIKGLLPSSVSNALPGRDSAGAAHRINKILGLGTREVTENQQLGELRRQQDPLQQQIRQINEERRQKFLAGLGLA